MYFFNFDSEFHQKGDQFHIHITVSKWFSWRNLRPAPRQVAAALTIPDDQRHPARDGRLMASHLPLKR
jgi:hypothetical protein